MTRWPRRARDVVVYRRNPPLQSRPARRNAGRRRTRSRHTDRRDDLQSVFCRQWSAGQSQPGVSIRTASVELKSKRLSAGPSATESAATAIVNSGSTPMRSNTSPILAMAMPEKHSRFLEMAVIAQGHDHSAITITLENIRSATGSQSLPVRSNRG